MRGSDKTDLERVEEIYTDWARGDYSGHAGLFHPEMKGDTFGMGEPIRAESYGEFMDNMRDWLSAWERPLTIEAEDFIQAGNRILVLIHWHGRGKGSGAQIEGRGAHLWTFSDGRVTRFDVYRDRDEARAALEAE